MKRTAATAGTLDPWRPRKRHRLTTVKWLGALDNQMFHGISKPLKFFQQAATDQWRPQNWRKWPMLTTTIDQGSDGVCATNCMARMLLINLFVFYDWSHGACNDLNGAYKDLGLYSFMLLFLWCSTSLLGQKRMKACAGVRCVMHGTISSPTSLQQLLSCFKPGPRALCVNAKP